MKEEHELELALFRYGLIHPLLDTSLSKGEKAALRKQILSKTHEIPSSSRTSVSERSLELYLHWYREGGFDALMPSVRKDAGTVRVIPEDVLEKAFEFKREVPERSIREVIRMLELSGFVEEGRIKNSTLSRLISGNIGNSGDKVTNPVKTYRRFQKEAVNDTWQSDVKHCIYLKDPKNTKEYLKTYLICFLDDRSRKVCGKIYFQENASNMEDCFRKALIKMGIPHNCYTDNAKIYRTKRLQAICAGLGSRLKYCQPYSPQSKGKLEKFNSFVDRSFEPEARRLGIGTIDELNEYFEYWLTENYNSKKHSELGMTPDEAHAIGKRHIREVTPEKLKEVFMRRDIRKADNTSVVSLCGNLYKLEGILARKRVELRYDAKNLKEVGVYFNGQRYKDAEPLKIRNNVWDGENAAPGQDFAETAEQPVIKTSYLKLLKEKYENGLRDKANRISFANLYRQGDGNNV